MEQIWAVQAFKYAETHFKVTTIVVIVKCILHVYCVCMVHVLNGVFVIQNYGRREIKVWNEPIE